jgi:hypothetical protein
MRYHAAPQPHQPSFILCREGHQFGMAESMVATIEATAKGRTSCFPFWYSVPQRLWMQLRLTKANAVKPPRFDEKISFLWLKRAGE